MRKLLLIGLLLPLEAAEPSLSERIDRLMETVGEMNEQWYTACKLASRDDAGRDLCGKIYKNYAVAFPKKKR